MSQDRIKFIVNPRSGENKTSDFLRSMRHYIQYYDMDASISITKDVHHAVDLADKAAQEGFNVIVAVGGDGTVHEVLQGIVAKDVIMGVIPYGSSNDFARTIKVPKNLKTAMGIIKGSKIEKVDVGAINDRFFLNISSAGFDGEVVARLPKLKSKYLFSLVYILGALKEVFRYKKKKVRVVSDGKDMGEFNTNLIVVANGKYYGHAMKVAPRASITDGKFDIILIHDMDRLRFLLNFPKVFKGTHIYNPNVTFFRSSNLVLFCDKRMYIESDGELTGTLPVEYKIFPKFIRLIVP